MAKKDVNTINLQLAVLNIREFKRGWRRISDITKELIRRLHVKGSELFLQYLGTFNENILFPIINSHYVSEPLCQLDDMLFSGSFPEGTFLLSFDSKKSSDVDFMFVLKNIKITEEDQKKGNLAVKENTPFVNLYLTDEDMIKTCADCLETSSDARWEGRAKVSSKKLKMQFREKHPVSDMLMPNNQDGVQDVDEGPSVAVSTKLSIPLWRSLPMRNLDVVLAIQCNGWPLCAQEWIFRPRRWPNQDLVQTIVKEGFHIVCKSSSEGDFRLSYSNAETLLIENLSELQFKTYRAFKSLVSHYKKNWSPNAKKAVCSYHLKTIVLWYCEKSDPIDWTKERVVDHLLSLIDDLILALNEKNLPMYFMPKYNLMERFEETTEAVEQMTELRFNINMITKAIISEERNAMDGVNVWDFRKIHEQLLYFKGLIQKQDLKLKDFFEWLYHHPENNQDEVPICATERLPSWEDIQTTDGLELLVKASEKSRKDINFENVIKSLDILMEQFAWANEVIGPSDEDSKCSGCLVQ